MEISRLSEEEKKAIELFNSYINAIDTFGTIDYKCINNLYEPAKTILNLVKKQQEEIENLKWKNKIYVKSIKSHKREIEKKDKIIDLLCFTITHEDIPQSEFCHSTSINCEMVGGTMECKDCIKQYFENKVERSK